MIKLDGYSDKFKEIYFSKYWKKIEKNVLKNQTNFCEYFDESCQNKKVKKEFFKEILTNPINELIEKYECVKEYHNLAFLISLDMTEMLKKMNVRKTTVRKDIRKEYLELCGAGELHTRLGKWTLQYVSVNKIKQDDICCSNEAWERYRSHMKKQYESEYGFLDEVFDYELIDRETKWNIVDELDVSVCPYCNRQYINNIIEQGAKRATADIDHFYYKAVFYLWKMSLYNFVPSCKICNSLFKLQTNMDIPYPYLEEYSNSAVFDIKGGKELIDLKDLFAWDDNGEIYLKYDGEIDKINKIKREADLFQIEALYGIHKGFANQLRYKKRVLGPQMIAWTIESILDTNVTKNIDKTNLIKMILYGIDVENIDCKKQPLGKLMKDILRE